MAGAKELYRQGRKDGVLVHDLPQIRGKMLYIPAQGGAMACSRNQHTPAHCGAQGRGEETDSL